MKRQLMAALATAGMSGLGYSLAAAPLASAATTCPPPGSTVTGNLVIPAGTTCDISGDTITGSVIVQPGGTVQTQSDSPTSIGGSVVVNAAAGDNYLCNTTIKGNVAVSNLPTTARFGLNPDEFAPCFGADTVGGSVSFTNNKGFVEVNESTIKGSLSATGNSGTSDEGSVGVEAVSIGASLSCSGNSPAPGNEGDVSTVGGTASGQCSSFTTPTGGAG